MDLGAMTASTVLGMYLDGQEEGNELIMLSELQVGSVPWCWVCCAVLCADDTTWCCFWPTPCSGCMGGWVGVSHVDAT